MALEHSFGDLSTAQTTMPAGLPSHDFSLVHIALHMRLISWIFKSEITGADFRSAKHSWLQRKPSGAVL